MTTWLSLLAQLWDIVTELLAVAATRLNNILLTCWTSTLKKSQMLLGSSLMSQSRAASSRVAANREGRTIQGHIDTIIYEVKTEIYTTVYYYYIQ